MSRVLLTVLHHFDPGMPPSRAKAQVQREVAVTQPTPQMMPSTSRGINKQNVPAELPMAALKMAGVGWPEARLTRYVRSGSTKQTGIKKRRPAIKLIMMVPTMAFGTMMAGSWTSSQRLTETIYQHVEQPTWRIQRCQDSRDNHAGRRCGVGSLQETNEERPSRGPPSLTFKVTKNPCGIVTPLLGDSQQADDNGE